MKIPSIWVCISQDLKVLCKQVKDTTRYNVEVYHLSNAKIIFKANMDELPLSEWIERCNQLN